MGTSNDLHGRMWWQLPISPDRADEQGNRMLRATIFWFCAAMVFAIVVALALTTV